MPGAGENDRRSDIERIDNERKHLEGLLKDRINFYIVFASVFMVGLSQIADEWIRAWALLAMTLVSLLITLAVVRTHRFVEAALADIRADDGHPYTKYWKNIAFPWDANWSLVFVPVVLTLFFAIATVFYFDLAFPLCGTGSVRW